MLRIATYYESRLGRNDGNPLYTWACMKRMQEKGLLEIDHLAPFQSAEDIASKHGRYDLHLWVDWGEDGLGGLLPYAPIDCAKPNAYWASDTHLGFDYRLSMARKFDHVFCAQKKAVGEFRERGIQNPIWLPHAVEPLAYPRKTFAAKKYDIAFVGHINSQNRVEALDRLFKEVPNFFYGQRLFNDAADIFAQSKIVFNISMLDDLNMRTFEGMATGSMMLTNRVPSIEDLFVDGKHLVLYDDFDDMVEKARYYLAHDDEREAIAEAGYQEVIANHTIQNRVDKILEVALPEFKKEAVHAGI